MTYKRSALVVNAGSRQGADWFENAERALEEKGIEVESSLSFESVESMLDAVRELLESGVERFLVGGGDGTQGAVADVLKGTNAIQAILPLGTGNALARDLGLLSVEQALDVVAHGEETAIDLGSCNGRTFVNLASMGVSTDIAEHLDSDAKRLFGKLSYVGAAYRAFAEATPFHVEIESDGEALPPMEAYQIVATSGRLHAGAIEVAPGASLVDGRLSLYVVRSAGRLELLRFAYMAAGGRHAEMRNVRTWHAERVRISATPSQDVTLDGETCQQTPIEISVVKHGLRVMAPAELAKRGFSSPDES